jgi:hypothetical protein
MCFPLELYHNSPFVLDYITKKVQEKEGVVIDWDISVYL